MKPRTLFFVSLLAVLTILVISACAAPTTPVPPTAVPVKPTDVPKATVAPTAVPPTAVPTVAPTATPWKPDRPVSIIVAWAAGGSNDVAARIMAPFLEKVLGQPVQIVNKAGGGGQTGFTEISIAKPDGLTLGLMVLPPASLIYQNEAVKPLFNRASFIPISAFALEPMIAGVKADSPYKTGKDLIEAARANPEKIKFGSTGLSATTHMMVLALQKEAGVKFARVQFNGDAEAVTALLGGHVDAASVSPAGMLSQVKAGTIRILGYSSKDQLAAYPDVKGWPLQGYNVELPVSRGIVLPKGAAPEVVEAYKAAMAKVCADPDFQKKLTEAGFAFTYTDQAAYNKLWDMEDTLVKNILPDLLAGSK